ncbi:MAG: nucleotidyltransferase family protein [Polyangiaceae bacterium]
MASAIVLCAGFGTRLRPLTEELPKPLVPVGDRTILEHALGCLARAGFSEVVINVHHLAEAFAPVLARASVAASVRVIVETAIRGTAGGVAGARAHLSSAPVLVWNGDILVDPPLDQLLVGSEPYSYRFGVAPRALGEGTVGLNADGHVVRLRGERFGTEARGGDYVGVLSLGAAVLEALPERGCLFADSALPLLRAGGTVSTAELTTPWTDAGDPQGLLAANLVWLSARGLDGFVAEGAELARGVRLEDSLVGAGARVLGQGTLTRVVVCPGATVTAPLSDAIVAPSGRVISAHV